VTDYRVRPGDGVHYFSEGRCHAATILALDATDAARPRVQFRVADHLAPRPGTAAWVEAERQPAGRHGWTEGRCHHPARCGEGVAL
jgi:hypothetical protein